MQISTFCKQGPKNREAIVEAQNLLIYLQSPNQEYKEEFIRKVKQLYVILTKLKHNSGSFPATSQ